METVVQQVVINETEAKSSFSFITHSNEDGRKSDSDGDADSYIEIQLEPVRLDGAKLAAADEELEMRISFSSPLVALPDVFSMDESFEKRPRSPHFTSSLSGWSFSSAETTCNSWSGPLSCQKKQRINENRLRSPRMSRLADMFLTSSGKFSEMGNKPGRQIDASNSNYCEFAQSRGSSCKNGSMVKRRQQGGVIMKIWMKLRSKNLRALVESLLTVKSSEGGLGKKKKKSSSMGDGFDRCLVQKERSGWSSRKSGDPRRAKSCPVSSKASPLHRDGKVVAAGECSIQAAIAHCKLSYAEP